jgi:DNA-binding NarL/FixJ family response regulator
LNVRVLVVDDQQLVRSGFRMILESEPDIEVVGEAADGREAVHKAGLLKPHVVLMDIRMPVLDGVQATELLAPSGARVLVVTTFDADHYVFSALRAGASGFVLKDAPPEDLVSAVRIVAAGGGLLAPKVTRRLIEEFSRRPSPGDAPRELEELTERELEVLRLMARGLSNSEIAIALSVGEATVKTHVGRVLMKLKLRDRVQAVVLAYECGLVRPGESAPGKAGAPPESSSRTTSGST